jgi:hypothetical protein
LAPAEGVPDDRRSPESDRADPVETMRVLALDATLAEIVRALAEHAIEPLLLKGAGTAQWLYDHPSERSYGDIDLLVDPARFDTTMATLAELGFEQTLADGVEPGIGAHHTVVHRRSPLPASVELHHTLYLVPAPEALVWRRLTEGRRLIEVAGVDVHVPSAASATMIVALHAVQHGRAEPKAMRDLALAVDRVELGTWRAAAELAAELGAGAELAAGLRLLATGSALADRLGLTAEPISRLVALRAMSPPDTSIGVERLIAAPGAGARLNLLARELFPAPEFMRLWKPVAGRGRAGLVVSYVWRPFWLAAKLPTGLRAWRRAERTARRSR